MLTDDDLATVVALADDALPLLGALWPRRDDLASARCPPPTSSARASTTPAAR
ncbi:MAG: hypothetical protein U0325_24690 [Polyangiales bacterium]